MPTPQGGRYKRWMMVSSVGMKYMDLTIAPLPSKHGNVSLQKEPCGNP